MHTRSKSNSKGYKKCELKDKSKIYMTKLYSKVEVKPKALNKTKDGLFKMLKDLIHKMKI